jgi:hypothetical protein
MSQGWAAGPPATLADLLLEHVGNAHLVFERGTRSVNGDELLRVGRHHVSPRPTQRPSPC